MALQKLAPPKDDIQRLYEEEFNDVPVNISFWQYVHVLQNPNADVTTTLDRAKGELEILYSKNIPLRTEELANLLKKSDALAAHGQQSLGGFAEKFWRQLQTEFPRLYPNPQQLNGAEHEWFSLIICDFIRNDENGTTLIYYYLKSRFRAALAHCFEKDGKLCW